MEVIRQRKNDRHKQKENYITKETENTRWTEKQIIECSKKGQSKARKITTIMVIARQCLSELTDVSVGGNVVDEDLGGGSKKGFDVNIGVEGAEIEVAETARDANGGQHARPLAFAQNDGVLEVFLRRRLERPTLRRRGGGRKQ